MTDSRYYFVVTLELFGSCVSTATKFTNSRNYKKVRQKINVGPFWIIIPKYFNIAVALCPKSVLIVPSDTGQLD